ncbi:MAG: 50S ribosomal protein L30e [archaeon GB-1867-005]|nr:50S ribosomal protein L30e [Candidatus Culexmicrobium cathedralense]
MPIDLERELKIALKTGKVALGSNSAIKYAKLGKGKLIILASNCPSDIKSDILYYSKLSKIPVYVFPGSSWELGSICRKPFMVAALTILDPGDSEILMLVEEGEG